MLYEIIIRCYSLGIHLASIFNPKAKKWQKGRINWAENLQRNIQKDKQYIWIHCASVGEYEQSIPLEKELKSQYPNYQFITTFFSPSGYEYAIKKHPDKTIQYLPLDTKKNATKFIKTVRPKAAFFIKYEFWRNHLKALKTSNTPAFLIAGIFRKEQLFFKRYGVFYKNVLSYFTHFFVQNVESKNLLHSIDFKNVSLSGDTRFDRVVDIKNEVFEDKKIASFIEDKKVMMFGSVWQSDEKIIKEYIEGLDDNWVFIIAPHEPNHYQIKVNEEITHYTSKKESKGRLMIINQLGLLSKLYRFAHIVYVGGGFGKGIHNILEAAIYKKPIIIGPNYQKFQEAKDLIELGQVIICSKTDSLKAHTLAQKVSEKELAASYAFMTENTNVSNDILVFIKKHTIL